MGPIVPIQKPVTWVEVFRFTWQSEASDLNHTPLFFLFLPPPPLPLWEGWGVLMQDLTAKPRLAFQGEPVLTLCSDWHPRPLSHHRALHHLVTEHAVRWVQA